MSTLETVNSRHSSESAEWFTPPEIIEAARVTMGGIDLDPASSVVANRTVGAAAYFDVAHNGFKRAWNGRVFLNPPGGVIDADGLRVVRKRGQAPPCTESGACGLPAGHTHRGPIESSSKAWWFKLAREFYEGRVTEAVFLGFSIEILQTTQVETPVVPRCKGSGSEPLPTPLNFALCFPSHRLAFIDVSGSPVQGNTHASVIVYLRKPGLRCLSKFGPVFADIGRVIGGSR